jgi:uncharacterized repeat protein (TIGR01451 family)
LLQPASALASDLSVTLDDRPGRVFVGTSLRYTLAVTNAGPENATEVRVQLSAPAQADTLTASGDLGECVIDGASTTCDVPELATGAIAAFTVTVRPTAPGRLIANVDVEAGGPPDPNLANNSAGLVTRVRLVRGPCSNLRRGTPGTDLLAGTRGGDAIFGRGGNDVIRGAAGDDCLSGAAGADALNGAGGDDSFFGDAGADAIAGGRGDDVARGGGGPDRIEGVEVVRAGAGADHVVAPSGATVACGPGQDFVRRLGSIDVGADCERVVPPVPPPPPAPPSPAPGGGGGGGGIIGGGDDGGGGRKKRCRRRYCRRGGIPAQVERRSPPAAERSRRLVP